MSIADAKFEEFWGWMVALETDIQACQGAVEESMNAVPVVERLMNIFSNALEGGEGESMLKRNRDITNTVIALYQIEKGIPAPSGE